MERKKIEQEKATKKLREFWNNFEKKNQNQSLPRTSKEGSDTITINQDCAATPIRNLRRSPVRVIPDTLPAATNIIPSANLAELKSETSNHLLIPKVKLKNDGGGG